MTEPVCKMRAVYGAGLANCPFNVLRAEKGNEGQEESLALVKDPHGSAGVQTDDVRGASCVNIRCFQ